MSLSRTSSRSSKRTTPEAFLDREEALAVQRIADSVQRLGDEIFLPVRRSIARHPIAATGIGAVLGFLGGPILLRAFKQALTATASVASLARRESHPVPSLVLASLRGLRSRRERGR